MAQSLRTVTKRANGGYEGSLAMLVFNTRITIAPNAQKANDRQPDLRIYAGNGAEIGGGWNRIGKTSGTPYVSLPWPIR